MVGLHCARWVTLHLLRLPWLWAAVVGGVGSWGLAAALGPPGIAIEGSFLQGAHYELAFLGALLGSVGGMTLLVKLGALLGPASTRHRLLARAVTLLIATTLGCLLLGVPPLALGSPVGPAELGMAAAGGVLHLGGLGLVLHGLTPRTKGASGALVLVGVAWLLPALLQGTRGLLHGLGRLVDVAASFRLADGERGPQLEASLATILAWLLAAILLELRRSPTAAPAPCATES